MTTLFPQWLIEIGLSGLFDITCLAVIIYFLLVWFKQTRAAFVLTGIVIMTGVYLLARQFNLLMTASLFENFFAIILIALVVIFQEELRNLFEKVAVWSLNRKFNRQRTRNLTREEVQILTRTLFDLAKEKIGALIVIRGSDLIARHLDGGRDLNGDISEGLLKSIFDPHSMGHDGAVVIEDARVTQYSAHLPLTKNLRAVGKGGTRHAAALGLSELSNALCLVVSEERGTISIAQKGTIEVISDPDRLALIIEKHYQETYPKRVASFVDVLRKNGREKFIAVLLSLAIWFVFSHGSIIVYRTYSVPLTLAVPPEPWVIKEYHPKEVQIVVYGPRKEFYFSNKDEFNSQLNVKKEQGIQFLRLTSKNFSLPSKNLNLDNIEPSEVKIIIGRSDQPGTQPGKNPPSNSTRRP